MAWKTPLLSVRRGVLNDPRASLGTIAPCVRTVIKMIIMLIKASVLAFANYIRQHIPQNNSLKIYLSNIPI